MARDDINFHAPVLSFDWPWGYGDKITACYECLPWSAEVIPEHPDGGIYIREWHAHGCSYLQERLEQ